MITFPSLFESIRKHRLTSMGGWKDRLLLWLAAALAGLCVVGFTLLTDKASTLFEAVRGHWTWSTFLITPIGGMVVVWLTMRFAQGASGSGIPQVMAALNPALPPHLIGRFVSLKLSIAKALLAAGALLSGFSTGREGPCAQIAAGVMSAFKKRFGSRSAIQPKDLVLAGGAAGIAAAFNAPLAGVVFAIEELARRFEQRTSGLTATAIIIAGVVSISFLGNYTYFGRLKVESLDAGIIGAALLCALSSGLLGGLFSKLLILSTMVQPGPIFQFKSKQPVAFAGICGLAIATLGYVSQGAAHGSGYQFTRDMLNGALTIPLVFVLIKFVATWISYWSGVPGGIFAPCLAIGAGLGNDIASLMHVSAPVPLIALGMVGFLAAVTQAPITSFIIVMEMIDGHTMVLSLMATALASSLISTLISPPLYEALSRLQLARVGIVEAR